ncbi:hypothetical protein EDD85DRAFT_959241 [Armillaria nabsnona]|nr:hypothetical protein EDD85DRAFT_959241 [Armillaria nabsnona]
MLNCWHENFEVMKKHYRLAAHHFKLRGILESLDNDNDDDGDDNKDENKEEADEDKETPDNFIGMDVYDALITYIFPNIEQNVQWLEGQADPEDPLQFIFELLSSINAGTQSGQTDDTSKINDNIIQYSTTNISNDTPVLDIRKYQCGFNHVHTAHLLCPQWQLNDFDKDPHLTAIRAMMVALPTKVTSQYLPSFLYDQTLVLGYLWDTHAFSHSITVKSKMSLCTITAQMVVYAVIQAHFALSSCGKWGEMSDNFNLEQFSVKLIKTFTDSQKDEGDDWATDTLKYYTIEVLKPKPKDDDKTKKLMKTMTNQFWNANDDSVSSNNDKLPLLHCK